MNYYCLSEKCSNVRASLNSENQSLRNQLDIATKALEFFVCQRGFPFGDFAECADMDVQEVVKRFNEIKETLQQIRPCENMKGKEK